MPRPDFAFGNWAAGLTGGPDLLVLLRGMDWLQLRWGHYEAEAIRTSAQAGVDRDEAHSFRWASATYSAS